MDIKWVGCDSSNYTTGRSGKSIDKIVLHWIVGTLESCDATFANPDRGASAHYGIGDNEIHQYVREEDTAWHASNWGVNQTSIGIEHEGGWLLDDGTRFKPTDKTHETSALLVADICNRYSLPIDRTTIHLHSEYSATQCPGSLDVDRIIELARAQGSTPDPVIISDPQTKLQLDQPWGVQELQATKSILNDQKKALDSCQSSLSTIEQACNTEKTQINENWQTKYDSAKGTYEKRIDALIKKNSSMTWSDLITIMLAKVKGGDNT